jgi:heme-degrading monooxygenase HmoA
MYTLTPRMELFESCSPALVLQISCDDAPIGVIAGSVTRACERHHCPAVRRRAINETTGRCTMFARKAFFRLKSISVSSEFAETFDREILPLLRSQQGFIGELLLANPGSLERITTSLWESAADADRYKATVYPQVLKILSKTIDGAPKIHTFDEVIFTLHNRVNDAIRISSYTQAAIVPATECADSSPRSTLSAPSTSA